MTELAVQPPRQVREGPYTVKKTTVYPVDDSDGARDPSREVHVYSYTHLSGMTVVCACAASARADEVRVAFPNLLRDGSVSGKRKRDAPFVEEGKTRLVSISIGADMYEIRAPCSGFLMEVHCELASDAQAFRSDPLSSGYLAIIQRRSDRRGNRGKKQRQTPDEGEEAER